MRKALAFAAVASLAIVPAAGASPNKGPTLRSLQTQVKSLQKQVTKLKKQTTLAENVAVAALAFGACSTAVTSDTFQDTFTGIEGHFQHTGTYFGAQTPVSDYQSCSALQIVRAHNQSPPNTNVMRALLDIFKPRSFAAHQSGVDLTRQTGHVFGQFLVLASQLRIRFK